MSACEWPRDNPDLIEDLEQTVRHFCSKKLNTHKPKLKKQPALSPINKKEMEKLINKGNKGKSKDSMSTDNF